MASGLMLTLLLIGMLSLTFNIQPVKSEPRTWTVDDDEPADFSSIQDAVDAASSGDMIFVYEGTYNEYVSITKPLNVTGENPDTTVVNGGFLLLFAYDVSISSFSVSGSPHGIQICASSSSTIMFNIVTSGFFGICLNYTDSGPHGGGHNIIRSNTISGSNYGIGLFCSSNNRIYHNNFRENTQQVVNYDSENSWDDDYPSGGNYWDDYTGGDANGDGIGDTPYTIDNDNEDNYPLMDPFQLPDLAIASNDISIEPNCPVVDEHVDIVATVHNSGGYAENVPVDLMIDDEVIETLYRDITKDTPVEVVFQHTFVDSGTYEITVAVDPQNRIPESNEDNNSAEKQQEVRLTPKLQNALLIDVYPIPDPKVHSIISTLLIAAGYTVTVKTQVDAEWLRQNFWGYGVIWWRAHADGQSIQTSEQVSNWTETKNKYSNLWNMSLSEVTNRIRFMHFTGFGDYVGIRPFFIQNFSKTHMPTPFPWSLIYVEACYTMQTNDYWNVFESCGAAAYLGYDDNPPYSLADADAIIAFTALCCGWDVESVCGNVNLVWDLDFRGHGNFKLVDTIQESLSMLRVAVESPVSILVTDSLGRRTGIDPETGEEINEIPDAVYLGNQSEPQAVLILNATEGTYLTELYGIMDGVFHITTILTHGFDSTSHSLTANIEENETKSFMSVMNGEIQSAIDVADQGETIYVSPGIYYENLVVDKPVSLIRGYGETTIIDGSILGNVMEVTADNVTITGFTVRNSGPPLPSGYGIALRNVTNCSIYRNNISNNGFGIWLENSSSNSMVENTITNNQYSVYLGNSSGNNFYHNNFINNTYQVDSDGSLNVWDDDYPSGGNYWSDYAGVDLYHGPDQNIAGSDGIGDTSHIIDENNRDNYPLATPWTLGSHVNLTVRTFGIGEIGNVSAWIDSKHPTYVSPMKIRANVGLHTVEAQYGFLKQGPESDSYIKYTFNCWIDGSTRNPRTILLNEEKTLIALYRWKTVYLW